LRNKLENPELMKNLYVKNEEENLKDEL